jgi:hypothetical protein
MMVIQINNLIKRRIIFMIQQNIVLPEVQEESKAAAGAAFERKQEPLLLNEVRQKFGIYGGIALAFGGFFTLLFYKAWLGLNIPLFTLTIITLLCIITKSLSQQIKPGTKLYYLGAALLGVSTTLTSSEILQFLNIIGILLLFDLSLLHQFYENRQWDFAKHLGRMLGLAFQSTISIWMPFVDFTNFLKRTRLLKNDRARNIFIGTMISIPFLFIITALLSGADLLFGKLTHNIFSAVFSADIFDIIFLTVFGFLACYCILCGTLSGTGTEKQKERAKADASIAVTIMTLLCLVYIIFCGIQLTYLFGNGLFVLPEEFTFAEYARRGFFELLTVTIINILLMLLASALFKESRLLRLLISLMTVCTYIMIASATYRMLLYIGAYQLTFLRVFVLLALVIDAFVLAGVLTYEYNRKFPLFQYSVAVVSICFIIFSFSKPDYFIASYLIDQKELLDAEDIIYLTQELSEDAAPAVLPLLADQDRWTSGYLSDDDNYVRSESEEPADYYIKSYYDRINDRNKSKDIRGFNYSYHIAGRYVKDYPLE